MFFSRTLLPEASLEQIVSTAVPEWMSCREQDGRIAHVNARIGMANMEIVETSESRLASALLPTLMT